MLGMTMKFNKCSGGGPNLNHVHQKNTLCVAFFTDFDILERVCVLDSVLGRDVSFFDHPSNSIEGLG